MKYLDYEGLRVFWEKVRTYSNQITVNGQKQNLEGVNKQNIVITGSHIESSYYGPVEGTITTNTSVAYAISYLAGDIAKIGTATITDIKAGTGINVNGANRERTISLKVNNNTAYGIKLTTDDSGAYVDVIEGAIAGSDNKFVTGDTVASYIQGLTFTDNIPSGYIITGISQTNGKLHADFGSLTENHIKIKRETNASYASIYKLVDGYDNQLGDTINIPKDQFLKAAKYFATYEDADNYKKSTTSDPKMESDIPGSSYFPHIWFKWELAVSGANNESWVSVKHLIDTHKSGDGINISDYTINAYLADSAYLKFVADTVDVNHKRIAFDDAALGSYVTSEIAKESASLTANYTTADNDVKSYLYGDKPATYDTISKLSAYVEGLADAYVAADAKLQSYLFGDPDGKVITYTNIVALSNKLDSVDTAYVAADAKLRSDLLGTSGTVSEDTIKGAYAYAATKVTANAPITSTSTETGYFVVRYDEQGLVTSSYEITYIPYKDINDLFDSYINII